MTPEKKADQGQKPSASTSPAGSGVRKSWVPRSPIDVMLAEIRKQEKRVADMQQAIDAEKVTLNKLLQAKKVLEST